MTIQQAMRHLRVKTHYGLAKELKTSPQTVDHWKKKGGALPPLWADRVKLRLLERA